MEENKKLELDNASIEDEKSSFDFQAIYKAIILNWPWFVLSLIICLGAASLYLRYKTPTYSAYSKFLIKDEENNRRGGRTLQNMTDLGIISNSAGIDNEMEILKSHSIATQTVRDLKLYADYSTKGRIKKLLYYKDQPVNVDIDAAHLEKLNAPITLSITKEGQTYEVEGTYYVPTDVNGNEGPFTINKKALEDGYIVLLDGTNASDDAGDRPGMRALRELSVLSPLRICGLTKAEIRRRSREAGLFTWDKPAYACLATRTPAGERLTAAALHRTEQAEAALHAMGFYDFRIRHRGDDAVIEVTSAQMLRLFETRQEVTDLLRDQGYRNVFLNLEARRPSV